MWKDVAVAHFNGISENLPGELEKFTKKTQAKDAVSGLIIETEYSELRMRNGNHYTETFDPLSNCNESLISFKSFYRNNVGNQAYFEP